MRVSVRIRIAQEEVFMGKGVRQLLDAIEECHSIRQATIKTGISYPKALRMIKTLNKELKFDVVESTKGGIEHGGTVLTEKGRKILEAYKNLEREVQDFTDKRVQDIFKCFM